MFQSLLIGFIPVVIGLAAAIQSYKNVMLQKKKMDLGEDHKLFPHSQTERTSRSQSQNTQPRLRRNNRQAGDGLSQCLICCEDSRIVEL
ncbi:hypothetical protein Btru_056977 [Bulinus truncatus]|nr:hypothetical protein Btru_056977 [Bulinus truncatus]